MRASKVIKKTEYAQNMDNHALIEQIKAHLDRLENAESVQMEQLGSLLMDVTALCRAYGVDAEEALSHATEDMIEEQAKKEAQ